MATSRAHRSALRELLLAAGCTDAELDQAEADGTLPLLAIERMVVPGTPEHDLAEVAARARMPVEQVAHLWRSLGFPQPAAGERVFTDADVENFRNVALLMSSGAVAPDLVLQMSRVIGSSIARIAQAQVDAVGTQGADEVGDALQVEQVAQHSGDLLSSMPRILEVVWRRHLQSAARRRLVRGPETALPQVVGFADLVGFTALSQQVTDHELAAIIDQFESLAYDVVTAAGGRVVKMIGDEVLFLVDEPAAAAEIALSLADALREADELSDVRVGMALGPVLEREGDCFGPTVNLASRATGIAYPGSVVVSDELHDALAADEGYAWRSMRPRFLKNIGRVHLWVLRRAGTPAPGPFAERRRLLRDAVRARLESVFEGEASGAAEEE
jgi:adenylate cyclase